MPSFSIVIPTRNRSQFLMGLLPTILQQSFRDFEVVVSDNASSDDTVEVVSKLSETRLRYVRSPDFLPIVESWNFAIQEAKGEYVLLIGDDDSLSTSLLDRVNQVLSANSVELLIVNHSNYYFPDRTKSTGNRVHIPRYSGQLLSIEPRAAVEALFGFTWDTKLKPCQPATIIARSVVHRILSRAGRFFAPPFPEWSAMPLVLSYVQSMLYLDIPLVIVGHSNRSLSAEQFHAMAHEDALNWTFDRLPLQAATRTNFRAASFMTAKESIPENFAGLTIGLNGYLKDYYIDLVQHAYLGDTRIELEMDRFRNFVNRLDDKRIRAEVMELMQQREIRPASPNLLLRIEALAAAMKGLVFQNLRQSLRARYRRKVTRGDGDSEKAIIGLADAGIWGWHSIADVAFGLDSLLSHGRESKAPVKWPS